MAAPATRYIFVTGGVLSGLGKGITAASIGHLLKARGLKVNLQKCDPYLNVDAGTLNPREHGECFVTADGAETDLDLGHYERFLDCELSSASSLMAGRVLLKVIQDERAGLYKGDDVQIIPHLTEAIQRYIKTAAKGHEVHIVEVGGTVGDYESLSFIEAIRELGFKQGRKNCLYVHVVYMPYLGASREFKTKPAQNSVRELRALGISPDLLVARSEQQAPLYLKKKLSLFSGLPPDAIALLPNAPTIYEVPLTLEDTGIADVAVRALDLKARRPRLAAWRGVVERARTEWPRQLSIALIAKYLDNQDTYMSVLEALRAAGWQAGCRLEVNWVDAEKLDSASVAGWLDGADGILVPGGFGSRGLGGKIVAADYALGRDKPYLGLCLGLQMAVVAAARRAGLKDANSTELDPKTPHPVIHSMADQRGKENTGGTMRLGNYRCRLLAGSLAARLYNQSLVMERHRHRYECNNKYRSAYAKWGLLTSGVNPDRQLVELVEAPGKRFFMACQFHPEFKSRPDRPHPLFTGFIRGAASHKL